ncbi:MAG: hypothetical protein K6A80_09810 [Saccharofermentans sp.]|nr:hypothetical protein [Saccharofermentans sp.]
MSDNRFLKLFTLISVTGLVITLVHLAYIYYAYENSSIIYFISQEIWP